VEIKGHASANVFIDRDSTMQVRALEERHVLTIDLGMGGLSLFGTPEQLQRVAATIMDFFRQ